jgi:predicted heme/steroid binding protein
MVVRFSILVYCLALLHHNTVASFTNVKDIRRIYKHTSLDVEPSIVVGGVVASVGAVAWWLGDADNRKKRQQYAEWETKNLEYQAERERLAFVAPRKEWAEHELQQYNGEDETGPILLAVKGEVFNVWKGRNFYGRGAEYNIMAGRDATRFLAKNSLVEENEEERGVELNIGERACLEAWYWTIKNKYEVVGKLKGYDEESTRM